MASKPLSAKAIDLRVPILIFGVLLNVSLCIFALTAHQLQTRLQALIQETESDNDSALEHIKDRYLEWKRVNEELQMRELGRVQLENKLSELQTDRVGFEFELDAVELELKETREAILNDLRTAVDQELFEQSDIDPLLDSDLPYDAFQSRYGTLTRAAPANSKARQLADSLATKLKDRGVHKRSLVESTAKHATTVKSLAQSADQIVQLRQRRKSLASTTSMSDALRSMQWFDDWLGGILFPLVDTPQQILTLALTVLMGLLGSALRLGQVMASEGHDRLSYRELLFQPLTGGVTAFAVFILAKAGVLIFTETRTDPGSAGISLSPYFISFLALISGMLSTQASNTIENIGKRFFDNASRGKSGRRRWAVGLKEALDGAGRKIDEALPYLEDVDLETATSWLEEVAPVPEEPQNILAAWLSADPRALFSDIPPDHQSSATS